MRIDFTPLVRNRFLKISGRTLTWKDNTEKIQREVLYSLLKNAAATEYGRKYGFTDILGSSDFYNTFSEEVPTIYYEDIRDTVLRESLEIASHIPRGGFDVFGKITLHLLNDIGVASHLEQLFSQRGD